VVYSAKPFRDVRLQTLDILAKEPAENGWSNLSCASEKKQQICFDGFRRFG
jgi:hypothetical protein